MDRRHDPRTIVTPYAFSVHPDLLGRPLATPWQRLGAIGLDLVVVFGLTRIGGATLAIASGLLLFWLAIRKPGKDTFGKIFRGFVGCLGILVLVITSLLVWGLRYAERLQNDPAAQEAFREVLSELDSAGIGVDLGAGVGGDSVDLRAIARLVPDLFALQGATDSDQAREMARDFAASAREGGMSLQDIRAALWQIMPENAPWYGNAQAIIDDAISDLRQGVPQDEEEASEGQGAEGPLITDSVALDSIAALNELVATLDEEREDVEDQLSRTRTMLEEAEERSPLSWLWSLIDDLGLGFGWAALYLTVTHAWWRGTSVGKKIFKIRVVMIDKRPLNWWLSFERAGGYAAGFATGLLGFAQIFWDPNRQAIHDKVSETIVIQDGKSPVPGPWIAEGKAQWQQGRPPDAEASPG